MGVTSLLAGVADHRLTRRVADRAVNLAARKRMLTLDHLDLAATQERTLMSLIQRAKQTRFGIDHDFRRIRSIRDYQRRVPVRDYEAFWTGYWRDSYPTLAGTTWPEDAPYYALSSGTTSGTTKYIPVTRDMLNSNRKAAFTTFGLYRACFPQDETLTGLLFFFGGSTALNRLPNGSLSGDLSGIASREVSPIVRPYTFPPLEISLLTNWEEKIERLADLSANLPITAISGIPAWLIVLFDRLKQRTGKATLAEIWPTLRLVVHGGTKFDPYRELFEREIGSDQVKMIETYPCSEGFIATEDPRHQRLRIIPDHGIFFEFIPFEELGNPDAPRHTLANVDLNVNYAVVLTTCAGVFSYLVGDTVRFERRDIPLIQFTGRTKYFLSAFGEHLISEEVEKAVAEASAATGATSIDWHVGPIFPNDPSKPGYHRYFIEFKTPPKDLRQFAEVLDTTLSRINEDYQAHRVGDLTMLLPEIRIVPPGGFLEWMKSVGKLGGQHKLPRMDNSGKLTLQMTEFFATRN
ncbi:Acyl-CoA synthetase (AMP-forming)/AMP-acid ligase II OS=Singulisphaera acidiphila (strain ATCC BAA-1392 / DSM 18658 / VKM B-2454 / MOB10) GN=Sinac_1599 PE=4 SV=1: GH3 [Tuwongella immobilis]|uniref:GH3 auxin-responsive promoter n=2 Tax=Tuwongella immobilis TaxID=692036 RepID=A0A6C2YHR3_9BACT|nr:Acyl-CoA synthetase (AMP-forming)/AMP-acid ligase II OS=Singulisphaera acidiphila (strain ATCC BAA-1392 / DSM 18658 / VKM B-2454 / MOB10) GN=Sinac_1599 PE=4 SV=1: GH3 [Tuwongella immobilis]VTR97332.1 Acyl-CoA synthetase (AMP-forming)/AMP-acid ligase II OS=Singulisphaera acidiphila (strain ATCC BAA-1392 / DSM 18658 / VKM B-2454 / MOB10) GN=Sinac_1599 PE=4 SV=1: GH3 [Tuwongella immobilis]